MREDRAEMSSFTITTFGCIIFYCQSLFSMKGNSIFFCLLFILSLSGFSQRDPVASRGKANLVPDLTVQKTAFDQYHLFLSTHTVIDSSADKDYTMVKRVGERIVAAAKAYYHNQKDVSLELNSYHWEMKLIGKKEANAWCLPDGKMAVYSGLLPIAQGEASLAVLVGHVTAHILLKHGDKRMKLYLQEKKEERLLTKTRSSRPEDTNGLYTAAYGMGTNAGIWEPFSIENEVDADKLGLIFCALAGYNPRVSLVFWERMARLSRGPQQPELVSIHPVMDTRIIQLSYIMDETVKKYYKPIIKK